MQQRQDHALHVGSGPGSGPDVEHTSPPDGNARKLRHLVLEYFSRGRAESSSSLCLAQYVLLQPLYFPPKGKLGNTDCYLYKDVKTEKKLQDTLPDLIHQRLVSGRRHTVSFCVDIYHGNMKISFCPYIRHGRYFCIIVFLSLGMSTLRSRRGTASTLSLPFQELRECYYFSSYIRVCILVVPSS